MYKVVEDGYILFLSENEIDGAEQINDAEHNEIQTALGNIPNSVDGYLRKLRATDLTWELVELPPQDDTDTDATESDYIDALQDLGVEVE